jgi:hypothetical protein
MVVPIIPPERRPMSGVLRAGIRSPAVARPRERSKCVARIPMSTAQDLSNLS